MANSITSAFDKRFKGNTGQTGLQGDIGVAGANAYGPLTIKQVNTALTTYTLKATDLELTMVLANNASANTVTIPPNSAVPAALGQQIFIASIGAGQTTLVAGAGVLLRTSSPGLKLTGQYSGLSGVQIAINEWLIFGDLEA